MAISVLITGFSVFPGAPVNPTEQLVRWFRQRKHPFGADVTVHTALFETAFASISRAYLRALERAKPDVMVEFGLARAARGFRLETVARNEFRPNVPDVRGNIAPAARVAEGPDVLPTGLPLERVERALEAKGLPFERSEDAGGYLCNTLFYLSRCGFSGMSAPAIGGFVHVPYLDEHRAIVPALQVTLDRDQLWSGACAIVDAAIEEFRQKHG